MEEKSDVRAAVLWKEREKEGTNEEYGGRRSQEVELRQKLMVAVSRECVNEQIISGCLIDQ